MFIPKHKRYTISPIWVTVDNLIPTLHWNYYGDYQTPTFKVFCNGTVYGSTTNQTMTISGLRSGVLYRFDVLALSKLENLLSFSNYISISPKGNRLQIIVPKVNLKTNPLFKSYLLFWSDEGTDPTVLMEEHQGANNNIFTTPQLEDGKVYKFRAKLNTIRNNATDYGPVISGSVNTVPEQVSSSAVAYDQGTRTATLTALKPSPQDSDVIGYNLYSNHLPGVGLQSDVCFVRPLCYFAPSQTLSFITKELCEGNHKWCFRAVDGSGLESDYETLELNLIRSGGELVQALLPPAIPYYIEAVAIDSGKVKITVRIEDIENTISIFVYRDSSLDGTIECDGLNSEYTFDTGALSNGTEYQFKATAYNGFVESGYTSSVSAVADTTAPSGDLTLTINLVD